MDIAKLNMLNATYGEKNVQRAKATAEDFESQFLAVMFDQMQEGIGEDDPFSGGQATNSFRSMLNEEYGKSVGQSGGIGLADAVFSEILAMQEKQL
jgi:Rod binding domain-containing protein